MSHPIYQVRAVEVLESYTLRVQFTDNTEQVINLKPVLAGELYVPLHEWPEHKEAFAAYARDWA